MAETSDTGGGICNISPSDQAGQINNIMDRLLNCEIAIAKIAGLDVSATNASDIVASLGTITNGTIISSNTGLSSSISDWAGTVLPGNFTGSVTSNGVTVVWNNGVVTFEVDQTGIVTGGGGGLAYAKYSSSGYDYPSEGVATQLNLDTEDADTIGLTVGSDAVSGFTTGWYLVTVSVSITLTNSPNNWHGFIYTNLGGTQRGYGFNLETTTPSYVSDVPSEGFTELIYIESGQSLHVKGHFQSKQGVNYSAPQIWVSELSIIQL